MTDEAQAQRVAAEILSEHAVPQTYAQAHAMIAYAYARGSRDGYEEGAQTGLTALDNLQRSVLEVVK